MALTIEPSFDVRASQADTWLVLTDIERPAPCFAGAELRSRNEDGGWQSTLNVKPGPLSFRFAGAFAGAAPAAEAAPADSAPASTAGQLNAGGLIWRASMHALCRRFRRLSGRRDG